MSLVGMLMWLTGKISRKMYVIPQQRVVINNDFSTLARILDLGGGGEGVIGQLRGDQVVAVDTREEELKDTPVGPKKVVADARDLPFDNETFDIVTAFYFLMYLQPSDYDAVFREAFRVLSEGGQMLIWDTRIPSIGVRKNKLFVVPVTAILPYKKINTAYGFVWKGREMSADHITNSAVNAGFSVVEKVEKEYAFTLVLKK